MLYVMSVTSNSLGLPVVVCMLCYRGVVRTRSVDASEFF